VLRRRLLLNAKWLEVLPPDLTVNDAVSWLAERLSFSRNLLQLVRIMRLPSASWHLSLQEIPVSESWLLDRLHAQTGSQQQKVSVTWPWFWLLRDFFSDSRQTHGCYLQIGYHRFLPYFSQFIIHNYPPRRHATGQPNDGNNATSSWVWADEYVGTPKSGLVKKFKIIYLGFFVFFSTLITTVRI
jgi:hypothetical protein